VRKSYLERGQGNRFGGAGEKPAGGLSVMATTESRGVVAAETLPPYRRDRGAVKLLEFFLQAVDGYRVKMCLPVVTLQVTLENDRKFSA